MSQLPNGNAHSLQIAPDRTWIGFLTNSGPASELYGVRPDGSGQAPIMPRLGGTNGTPTDVREFAWLPADVAPGRRAPKPWSYWSARLTTRQWSLRP